MFDFSNYSTKLKYYYDSNKLVIGQMKDETVGVAVKGFFWLKPKIYSFLVDGSSDHIKLKGVENNHVTIIWKDVLLNNKYLKHSMNRIQSRDDSIGTYKIKWNEIMLWL